MAPDAAGPSRFKSRFSLLSLLPARHPPLKISAPRPLPPTQHVAARQPTIVSLTDSAISPVHSEYPDTAYSSSPSASADIPPVPPLPPFQPPPHRPPPLDLTRTKEAYPGVVGLIPTAGTVAPARKTVKEDKQDKKEKKRKERQVDDPFEVVEVEPGHKYTSWKGGRVSIKPGQVIPRGTLATPTIRGEVPDTLPNRTTHLMTPDQYESVLHNVLLTPTYLGVSPALPPTPSPLSSDGDWPSPKRKTLLDAVKRGSKWIARGGKGEDADRAVRGLREREAQEMERYRLATRPVRMASQAPIVHVYHNGTRSQSAHKQSPASREWNIGVKWSDQDTKPPYVSQEKDWRRKKEEEKQKKKQRLFKLASVLAILCLAALIIGLCTSLLTGSSDKPTPTATESSSIDPLNRPFSSTHTASSSSPTPTSRTLTTCLDLFATSAPSSPLTYPCGDCVPLLTGTTNDYTQSLVNGNSTGVGAALQFCALMDVYKGTPGSGLQVGGWMKDGSPCGWEGATCDDRGRLTELQLQYPNVPDKLPDTLSNLAALQTFRLMGNTTAPTGAFPTNLLKLDDIATIDIEYTALTGPFSSVEMVQAKQLSTLYLVNNQQLGNMLPDLSGNSQLKTLAVTGQGVTNISGSLLPTSLTYLDLSYNKFTGQVPSLSKLVSLQTLYLTNNGYTAPPDSLPATLTSLSLTANPGLEGFMPADVCSNSALTSCDLRSTKLMGPNMIPGALSGISLPTSSSGHGSASATSTASNTSTSASAAATGKVCGVCRF